MHEFKNPLPRSLGLFELLLLFSPFAAAIGSCPAPCEFAIRHDKIFVANRAVLEPTLQDLSRPRSITRLPGQRRARHMRSHAVVGHAPPGMVCRRRLWEPHVPRIARELTTLKCMDDVVAIADLGTRSIYEVRAVLHPF